MAFALGPWSRRSQTRWPGTAPTDTRPELIVVAATRLEARAARQALAGVRVVRSGVGLSRLTAHPRADIVISVGLAGGLRDDAAPGTVVVPTEVVHGGERVTCDERWSRAFADAALRLGFPLLRAPLLSTDSMVTEGKRTTLAQQGFAAVDMETALLAENAQPIAAVRTLLDTPGHELSTRWQHPAHALLDPRCWSEGIWLARHAPVFARRAALVLASALAEGDIDTQV